MAESSFDSRCIICSSTSTRVERQRYILIKRYVEIYRLKRKVRNLQRKLKFHKRMLKHFAEKDVCFDVTPWEDSDCESEECESEEEE